MKTKILFAATLLLIIGSCKKENIAPVAGGEILSKVTITEPPINRTSTGHYIYNNAGQLTSIIGTNNVIGNTDTTWSLFTYDASGHLSSLLVTNNTTGNQYQYDYTSDATGNIVTSTGIAMQPNMFLTNCKFVYDAKGRIVSDSFFTKNSDLYGYSLLEYDNYDNISNFQDFVIVGSTVSTQGKFTYQYDNKRSPFSKIGKLLYQIAPGAKSYFYLNKNNTTVALLEGVPDTPGGYFVYQYYDNDLLHVQKANATYSLVQEFFYE
jgi:hypothetical protein